MKDTLSILENIPYFAAHPFMVKVVGIAATIIIGIIVVEIIIHIAKKALKHSTVDEMLYAFVLNTLKALLWLVLIATVLAQLGASTSAIVAAMSAAGAAIALALKDGLSNVVGGLQVAITRPFVKGDHVVIEGTAGIVDEINVIKTSLRTVDGRVVYIPNGRVANGIIENWTRTELIRITCTFQLARGADIYKVKEMLLAIAELDTRIASKPEPFLGVTSHEKNILNMEFRFWCSYSDADEVRCFVEENVRLAFEEGDIPMATPANIRICK